MGYFCKISFAKSAFCMKRTVRSALGVAISPKECALVPHKAQYGSLRPAPQPSPQNFLKPWRLHLRPILCKTSSESKRRSALRGHTTKMVNQPRTTARFHRMASRKLVIHRHAEAHAATCKSCSHRNHPMHKVAPGHIRTPSKSSKLWFVLHI